MEGFGGIEDDGAGIIPRALATLFEDSRAGCADGVAFRFRLSMLDIYMERLRDLLAPDSGAELQILEERGRGVCVRGLREVVVGDLDKAMDVFRCGQSNRAVSATGMNELSSRSHSIFMLRAERIDGGRPGGGKLCLVDLAGSECLKKSFLTGKDVGAANAEIAEEAKAINQSLTTLGLVVNRLADRRRCVGGDQPHVPYRSSKLTRVLQDTLGGSSQTLLVINCAGSLAHAPETVSTLRFGARASTVVNVVRAAGGAEGDSLLMQTLRAARKEIQRLRAGVPGTIEIGHSEELPSPIHVAPSVSSAAPWNELLDGWMAGCQGPRPSAAPSRRASLAPGDSVSPLDLTPRSTMRSRRPSRNSHGGRIASRSHRSSLIVSEADVGTLSPLDLSPRSLEVASRRVSRTRRLSAMVVGAGMSPEARAGMRDISGEDVLGMSSLGTSWEFPLSKPEKVQRLLLITEKDADQRTADLERAEVKFQRLNVRCESLQAENEWLSADRMQYLEQAVRSSFEASSVAIPTGTASTPSEIGKFHGQVFGAAAARLRSAHLLDAAFSGWARAVEAERREALLRQLAGAETDVALHSAARTERDVLKKQVELHMGELAAIRTQFELHKKQADADRQREREVAAVKLADAKEAAATQATEAAALSAAACLEALKQRQRELDVAVSKQAAAEKAAESAAAQAQQALAEQAAEFLAKREQVCSEHEQLRSELEASKQALEAKMSCERGRLDASRQDLESKVAEAKRVKAAAQRELEAVREQASEASARESLDIAVLDRDRLSQKISRVMADLGRMSAERDCLQTQLQDVKHQLEDRVKQASQEEATHRSIQGSLQAALDKMARVRDADAAEKESQSQLLQVRADALEVAARERDILDERVAKANDDLSRVMAERDCLQAQMDKMESELRTQLVASQKEMAAVKAAADRDAEERSAKSMLDDARAENVLVEHALELDAVSRERDCLNERLKQAASELSRVEAEREGLQGQLEVLRQLQQEELVDARKAMDGILAAEKAALEKELRDVKRRLEAEAAENSARSQRLVAQRAEALKCAQRDRELLGQQLTQVSKELCRLSAEKSDLLEGRAEMLDGAARERRHRQEDAARAAEELRRVTAERANLHGRQGELTEKLVGLAAERENLQVNLGEARRQLQDELADARRALDDAVADTGFQSEELEAANRELCRQRGEFCEERERLTKELSEAFALQDVRRAMHAACASELEGAGRERDILEERLNEATASCDSLRTQLEASAKEYEGLGRQLDVVREELNHVLTERNGLQARIKDLVEDSERNAWACQEVDRLQQAEARLLAELEDLKQTSDDMLVEKTALQRDLQEARRAITIESSAKDTHQRSLSQRSEALEVVSRERDELRVRSMSLSEELSRVTAEFEVLRVRNDEKEQRLCREADLERHLQEARRAVAVETSAKETNKRSLAQRSEALESALRERDELRIRVSRISAELTRVSAERTILKERNDELEQRFGQEAPRGDATVGIASTVDACSTGAAPFQEADFRSEEAVAEREALAAENGALRVRLGLGVAPSEAAKVSGKTQTTEAHVVENRAVDLNRAGPWARRLLLVVLVLIPLLFVSVMRAGNREGSQPVALTLDPKGAVSNDAWINGGGAVEPEDIVDDGDGLDEGVEVAWEPLELLTSIGVQRCLASLACAVILRLRFW
eukprot:TRINITY_DN31342_c0_g1_i1.p1 TRINITY_DN31342_c0_g1~~TRINITY_DN31342_c0_g1_i1.p1  ORF type:complete len:1855 (-),score=450.94 TRINITY_DN31342_c0_g1_i1:81-5147(-)